MTHQPSLFPSTRRDDPLTSYEAAAVVEPFLHKLQAMVLQAFEQYGDMTDEQLSNLFAESDYAQSTIRSRRNELAIEPLFLLEKKGITQNSRGRNTTVWGLVGGR